MPQKPRKNPQLFDSPRQSSEKTDPAYTDKADARLHKAYLALKTAEARADFMKNLTKEDRHALKQRLAGED